MSRATDFRHFEIPQIAVFEEAPGGMLRLHLSTTLGEAEIYLQGAHISHFRPTSGEPVIFMSRESFIAPGKAMRGGIPVCFPWFAAHATRPDLPAHGFARTTEWDVESITGEDGGAAVAVLKLASSEATRALWPHDFLARLRIEVTEQLRLTLVIENTSAAPFTFEEALHTYFIVSDVREVAVRGLEEAEYVDKTDEFRRKAQGAEPIRITRETDRVFPKTRTTCHIDDSGAGRRISVEKKGSDTTVVWNPWIEKAARMPDFGDDEWGRMLCIETANSGEDAVTLAPGARHSMTAVIRCE